MAHETAGNFDLDAYLRRIGFEGPREPRQTVLERVHFAHATHVPFENFDILLGRPIRLDLDSLQEKLVRGRRGGYCFEQNTLFAAALEALGFRVTRLAARVRFGASRLLARTHMLLEVDVDGSPWLADVGFGGDGLLLPVPLRSGQEVRHFLWTYRVVEADGLWVLKSLRGAAVQDLYAFTREAQFPVDYEMANYFTSTHPDSIFVRTLTAQRPSPEARHILRGRERIVDRGDHGTSRTVADDASVADFLADLLGLELPPDSIAALLRRLPPPG